MNRSVFFDSARPDRESATRQAEPLCETPAQWDETFDIGSDTGTPVDDDDYQVPFKFTGKLSKFTIKIDRPQLTPEDEKRLMQAERNKRRASSIHQEFGQRIFQRKGRTFPVKTRNRLSVWAAFAGPHHGHC